MIITITTSTVAAMDLTAAVGIAAVVSLIFLLTARELVSVSGSSISSRITRFFGIGIVPLVMTFAVIVAVKIAEVIA